MEVYWSGPPGTLFFRDGDADWTESSSSERGVHTLCVTSDRYVVSSGCRMGDTVAIREHFGMTADGGLVVIGTCFGAPVEPVEPVKLVTVRGTVRQPGNVFIAGQWRSGSTSDWEFEHTIPRDTYDVLAVEDLRRPSSVLLRRGLAASTEIVEPPLDFTTEGMPMTVAVPSITGLDAADRVSTDTVLELGGHIAVVAVLIADEAHLVPAAVRGDATQHVTVAAFRDAGPGQSFLRLETRGIRSRSSCCRSCARSRSSARGSGLAGMPSRCPASRA